MCLAIDPRGAPQRPGRELMARLSGEPSVRRAAECDPRPAGAVEAMTLRRRSVVTAGPIEWIADDEAWVVVSCFRSASRSTRRRYRVVREPDGWVSLGPILLDGPARVSMARPRPVPVIETPRLWLHRMTTDDADFILELLNEPSFLRFIGDKGVRTREDACRYILAGPMAGYDRFGFGLYRVDRKDGGGPIGMCGLLKRDSLEDVDVGFAFLPRFWSNGFASSRLPPCWRTGGRPGVSSGSWPSPPPTTRPRSAWWRSSAFASSGWRASPRRRRKSRCSRRRSDYSVSSFLTRRVSSAASSIDTPPRSSAFVASLPR